MVAIGIWLATFGYTLVYYGLKVWTGADETIGHALGIGG